MPSRQKNRRRAGLVVFYHWGKEGCRRERTTTGVRVGSAANATRRVPISTHVFADHDHRVGPGDSLGRRLRGVGDHRNPPRVRNPRCRRAVFGRHRSTGRSIRVVHDDQKFACCRLNQCECTTSGYRQVRHAHDFCRDFYRAVCRSPRRCVTATKSDPLLGVDKRKRQHVTDREVCVFDATHVLFGDVDVQRCDLTQFTAISPGQGDGVGANR